MTNPCQGHAAESARAEQPEALRLADMVLRLRSHLGPWRDESDPDEQAAWDGYTEAAAELRRLHALCEEIAEIAHNGGLVGMSESDALRAIRKITLPYWRQSK